MDTLMYDSEYEAMFHSEDRMWWYVGLRDVLFYFLDKYADQNAIILDAGSGTGKNSEFLIDKGFKNVRGIEYSPLAINFCKKRGLKNIEQGSLTAIPLPDRSVDVIYCTDVLYIFEDEDRKEVVYEFDRILKEDGILIVHSAALEALRSQHDDVINTKKRFTKKEHENLLKEYNYEILKSSYRVFFLFPLIFLFKYLKKLSKSKSNDSKTDQTVFPFGINWVLTKIQLLENYLFRYTNFPIGSSVFLVARKKG